MEASVVRINSFLKLAYAKINGEISLLLMPSNVACCSAPQTFGTFPIGLRVGEKIVEKLHNICVVHYVATKGPR